MLSRKVNIVQKETIYARSKLIKELDYDKTTNKSRLLCIWDEIFKYRIINKKIILQYIQDKKQEKNIIRLGMNEEMRQDINKTQLSKHVKP